MRSNNTIVKSARILMVAALIILVWVAAATAVYADHIVPKTEYLLDETGNLTLADLIHPENTMAFKACEEPKFQLGIVSKVLWLRFKIDPPFDKTDCPMRILGIDKPFSYVDLYLPVVRGGPAPTYKIVKAGFVQEKTDPGLNHRYPIFQLPSDLPSHQYIYLRIKPFAPHDSAALNFSLFIESQDSFYRKSLLEFSFYGIVAGVMGAMILYNLFLYLVLKDRAYLLYFLYIFFTLVYFFFRIGIINMIGLSGLKSATIPCISIAFIFACLFSQSFLETRHHCPVYDKFIWGFIFGAILVFLAILIGRPREANILIHLLGLVVPFIMALTAFQRVIQGYSPAQTYLAAWTFLLLGSIFIAGIGLKMLPSTFLTKHALFMGSAIESILLSIALAQRINELQKEKEKLKKKGQYLENLSRTDALTGLYNKRWFSKSLDVEVCNCCQFSTPLSLIIVDVDHFKKFNDTYGHVIGDKVLALLGKTILSSVRESDIACRYGGEEFCVILPKTGVTQAVNLAERLRQRFERLVIPTDSPQTSTHATISIGVTEFMADESCKELFVRADKALYQAKSTGRNRVVSMS